MVSVCASGRLLRHGTLEQGALISRRTCMHARPTSWATVTELLVVACASACVSACSAGGLPIMPAPAARCCSCISRWPRTAHSSAGSVCSIINSGVGRFGISGLVLACLLVACQFRKEWPPATTG
jgi:hypothetical protein